jgi:transposase-like protein
MKSLRCPNRECPLAGVGNIIRHGFYQTSSGKRRRYLCRSCGKTFCANTGTMPGPGLCRMKYERRVKPLIIKGFFSLMAGCHPA